MKHIFFLLLICSVQCYTQPNADYNLKGDKAVKDKRYDDAFSFYVQGVNKNDEYSITRIIDLEWNGKVAAKDLVDYNDKLVPLVNRNSSAAYLVGYFLYEGIKPISKNDTEAFKYFKISAEAGNYKGIGWLADCYANGIGCKQSITNAIKWLNAFIKYDNKNPSAYYRLSKLYAMGDETTPRNVNKILENLKNAYQYGNAKDSLNYVKAALECAQELNNETINKNALQITSKLYETNNILEAGYYLTCLYNGKFKGINENIYLAKEKLELIIKNRDFSTQNSTFQTYVLNDLGCIHYIIPYMSPGENPNIKLANIYFTKSYNIDSTSILNNEPYLCKYVSTIAQKISSKECEKAIRLFNKIKNKDIQYECYLNIANVYLTNPNCKNEVKASEMYQEIYQRKESSNAEKGYACNQMGYMHFMGMLNTYRTVKQMKEAALEWFDVGAKLGDAQCMYWLALMYEKGEGVVKSKQKALEWGKKSFAGGYYASKNIIDRLK
jgi:TPR repeat protein